MSLPFPYSGSHRENFSFIQNGEININDSEPRAVNRFYKNSDDLAKSNQKIIDKDNETLEVAFFGYMIKHTMVFYETKRSS